MKKYIKFIAIIAITILIFIGLTACNNDKQGNMVSFDTNGGVKIASYYTDFIAELPLTEKEGYYFDSWYFDEEFSKVAVFPLEIMQNTTLYARWFTQEEGSPSLIYEMDKETEKYTVVGYNGMSHNVRVPATYEDIDVIKIGYGAFNFCDTIKEIFLSDNIIEIDRAFTYCPSLTDIFVDSRNVKYQSINGVLYSKDGAKLLKYPQARVEERFVLPTSVRVVENFSIRYCFNLKIIELGKNVASILELFEGCLQLEGFEVDQENQHYKTIDGVLYSKDELLLVKFPQNKLQVEFNVPIGVLSIDDNAFSQSSIEKIVLPSSIQNVSTFNNFQSLAFIEVDEANNLFSSYDGVLFDKEKTKLLYYPSARENGEENQYVVPDGVLEISSWAFNDCLNLNKIIIATSVKVIKEYAFTNLINSFNLKTVEFMQGSQLEVIAENAFVFCPLKELILTAIMPPVIGDNAFMEADDSFTIIVPKNLLEIYASTNGYSAFELQVGENIKEFQVKFNTNGGLGLDNIDTVLITEEIVPQRDNYVFGGWFDNHSLIGKSLTFPLAVDKNIELHAKWYLVQQGTEGLEFLLNSSGKDYSVSGYSSENEIVDIPQTHNGKLVTAIADNAFSKKTFIRKVSLPQTIESIGDYAFAGDFNNIMRMESIEFAEKIQLSIIGKYAFQYCKLLQDINLPSQVQVIANGAFLNCTMIENILLPTSIINLGDYVFSDCTSLKAINIDNSNGYYASVNGVLYNKDKSVLVRYPEGALASQFVVPNSVQTIATEAFYSCNNLKELDLTNVKNIESRAFHYCNNLEDIVLSQAMSVFDSSTFRNTQIKNITLSATIEVLEDNFHNIYYLENIFVHKDNTTFKSVEGILYSYNLENLIRCPIGKKGKVVLSESLKYIGEKAFYKCQIGEIELNEQLLEIGKEAFLECKQIVQIEFFEALNYIGDFAFAYARNLRYINLLAVENFPRLGNAVFAEVDNGNVATIYANGSLLTQLKSDEKWKLYTVKSNTVITEDMELQLAGDGEYYRLVKYLKSYVDVVVPSNYNNIEIREINSYAFSEKTIRIILPNTIRKVNSYAFSSSNNSMLSTIIFEDNSQLENVSANAFDRCDRLSIIIITQEQSPTFHENAFNQNSSIISIYVPSMENYIDFSFEQCHLRNIENVESDFVYFQVAEGVVIDAYIGADSIVQIPTTLDGQEVIAVAEYAINSTVEKVIIDQSVRYIYDNAFSAQRYNQEYVLFALKEVEIIGQTLIGIGQNIFWGSQISVIDIPASIQDISCSAFVNCLNLNAINVASDNQQYCSDNGVLYSKEKDVIVNYPSGRLNVQYSIADTVQEIAAYAFESAINLVKLNFNDNLETIGKYALYGCTSLLDVSLPNGILRIEEFAFRNCSAILGLNLPINLLSFDSAAVVDCYSLKIISVNADSDAYVSVDGVLFDADIKALISYPAGRTGNYSVPESVESIAPYAFYGNQLNSIIISPNIVEIGKYAFAMSKNLTVIELDCPLYSLAEGMFYGCSLLERIIVPHEIVEIEAFFAQDCKSLQFFSFGEYLSNIGQRAFAGCTRLTEIVLPLALSVIGDEAFSGCRNLSRAVLPNNLKIDMGQGVFKGSTNINQIAMGVNYSLGYLFGGSNKNIPATVKNIIINEGFTMLPQKFFVDCSYIEIVELPNTLNRIGGQAFMNCGNLNTVKIRRVEIIEDKAFWNCNGLKSVEIQSQEPPSIEQYTFWSDNGKLLELKVYVLADSVEEYIYRWGDIFDEVYAL